MITLERDRDRALAVRPSVSAAIFDRRGRVLLPQRSDGGQGGLPGGSVEIGESGTDAGVRGETGLSVSPRRLVDELRTCDEALALFFPLARPRTRVPDHRVRIRDACARRVAAFVR